MAKAMPTMPTVTAPDVVAVLVIAVTVWMVVYMDHLVVDPHHRVSIDSSALASVGYFQRTGRHVMFDLYNSWRSAHHGSSGSGSATNSPPPGA
jgi:hypothetical protein